MAGYYTDISVSSTTVIQKKPAKLETLVTGGFDSRLGFTQSKTYTLPSEDCMFFYVVTGVGITHQTYKDGRLMYGGNIESHSGSYRNIDLSMVQEGDQLVVDFTASAYSFDFEQKDNEGDTHRVTYANCYPSVNYTIYVVTY